MSSATLFDHLTQVKLGDLIYVDVYGRGLTYQVDQIKVVLPNQIDDLIAVPGQDLITLFTCTPYAVNTHRLLVRAHRVADQPTAGVAAQATTDDLLTFEPWMYGLMATAVVGLTLVAVLWRRSRKRDEAAKQPPRRAESDRS
jgi:sortase A